MSSPALYSCSSGSNRSPPAHGGSAKRCDSPTRDWDGTPFKHETATIPAQPSIETYTRSLSRQRSMCDSTA